MLGIRILPKLLARIFVLGGPMTRTLHEPQIEIYHVSQTTYHTKNWYI
jgi:hypothetical protein